MSYKVTQPPIEQVRDPLVRLWEQNLRPLDRLQRYEWYYLNNPAGPGTTFLLHSDANGVSEIVGCVGVAPRHFESGGRKVRALLSADFAVDKAHRTAMPALMLQRAARSFGQSVGDFSYGFPNASAVGIFLRTGYRQLGCVCRYAKVLRHEEYLRSSGYVPGLAPIAARLLDRAASIRDSVRFGRPPKHTLLEWLPDFDPRFDEMWDAGRVNHPIIGNRGAEWLRWRFGQQSGSSSTIAVLKDTATGKLRAYAVVAQKEEGIARIGDFFAVSREDLSTLLALVCSQLRRQQFRSIWVYFLGARWVEEILNAYGFVLRDADRPVVVDIGTGLDAATFLDSSNWYLTAADTDT